MTVIDLLKKYWVIGVSVLTILIVGYIGYGCGRKSRANEVAELTTKLVTSEQTIEVEKGIFAKKSAEAEDLKDLLAKTGAENTRLAELITKGQMEVLTLNQLVIKWKKAYDSAVAATQTTEPPVNPGDPERKRVTFSGKVGPITVDGYTLTDPAYAYLKWAQTEPLRLTVAVTKNRDGTFSSLVTSSDDDIQTEVAVSAVDTSVLAPKWRQRIWAEAGFDFVGDRRAFLGISYHFDRVSLGVQCSSWTDATGCGLTAGYRLFK